MELDDFKQGWQHSVPASGYSSVTEEFVFITNRIKRSRRRLWKVLLSEMVLTVVIYACLIVFFVFSGYYLKTFILKMLIAIFFMTLPVFFRLYYSLRMLDKIDYGKNISDSLHQFLRHYKKSVCIYQSTVWVTMILLVILFYTDISFLKLDSLIKACITCFLALIGIFGPYSIKQRYHFRSKSIEKFLDNE